MTLDESMVRLNGFRDQFELVHQRYIAVQTQNHASYDALAKNLERSIFMVGFAVIISAIIQLTNADGLTPYHALVVLNISLLNTWTGVLLVQSRGGFVDGKRWKREHILDRVPCIAHTLLLCGFGLYFWVEQATTKENFLRYTKNSTSCRALTYYWVFGSIECTEKALMIASTLFYILFPIFGIHLQLLLHHTAGIVLVTVSRITAALLWLPFSLLLDVLIFILALIMPQIRRFLSPDHYLRGGSSWRWINLSTAGQIGLIYHFLDHPTYRIPHYLAHAGPIVYLIVSTESMIKVNSPNVLNGEDKWTYGQTLAVFTASVTFMLSGREW
ncbi:hypothetical protein L218DRAFT_949965 [Marasmius fiardii PR-910]|nr:hypothetical protein L218DRAFT_949965 [Marasmius fiardii PR-910]